MALSKDDYARISKFNETGNQSDLTPDESTLQLRQSTTSYTVTQDQCTEIQRRRPHDTMQSIGVEMGISTAAVHYHESGQCSHQRRSVVSNELWEMAFEADR